jgi:hypothetical protein
MASIHLGFSSSNTVQLRVKRSARLGGYQMAVAELAGCRPRQVRIFKVIWWRGNNLFGLNLG